MADSRQCGQSPCGWKCEVPHHSAHRLAAPIDEVSAVFFSVLTFTRLVGQKRPCLFQMPRKQGGAPLGHAHGWVLGSAMRLIAGFPSPSCSRPSLPPDYFGVLHVFSSETIQNSSSSNLLWWEASAAVLWVLGRHLMVLCPVFCCWWFNVPAVRTPLVLVWAGDTWW